MLFRQFFESESGTYTYLLADKNTLEGLIIDPVREMLERDLQFIQELGIRLLYTVETHVHADHVTAADAIRKRTGAKVVLGHATQVTTADLLLRDGETLAFGRHILKALHTPGHTDGCTSYFIGGTADDSAIGRVFTGDTLLIRGCGRTDFQSGSSENLFRSVREKLFTLPDETLLFPGHDYHGRTCSSIGEEKKFNPRLNLSVDLSRFNEIMKNLNLAKPKMIDVAVPANLQSGAHQSGR